MTKETCDSVSVEHAVHWLEQKAISMIRAGRRFMDNGVAAFPPQVGSHYDAFWLRDYAYMLEGAPQAFTQQEMKDACLLFVGAQREDGAMVDCIKFDGTSIYQPGMGTMGQNPVADGAQFTVDVAWRTYQHTADVELVQAIVDRLVKAMNSVPRNPATRLVFIKPQEEWDRCPYGFTDTVHKQGDELFCSLLFVQACRQLADLLNIVKRFDEASQWNEESQSTAQSVRKVFWDEQIGLFRAATIQSREPDIWGSAFAVYLGVASAPQSLAVAHYFRERCSFVVKRGQIRHLPAGIYWQSCLAAPETYQNGAYWATPAGWFVAALNLVDADLARQTILDLVHDFQHNGVHEWINDGAAQVSDYIASAALPLHALRLVGKC